MVTVSEVSAETGIPEGTWRYWKHLGKGPKWVRLGRRLRAPESAVKEWLDEQMSGDNPAA
jgi:predicted DNA-binding transcriptional regulator AlpA